MSLMSDNNTGPLLLHFSVNAFGSPGENHDVS